LNWRNFLKRDLDFYDRLKRLHFVNAVLVFVIMFCGFLLITPAIEEWFPSLRYAIKHFHYFVATLILLTIFFYLPKMKAHFQLMRQDKKYRVVLVLILLLTMIGSGFVLGFLSKPFPVLGKIALVIHDTAFIMLVAYVLFHAMAKALYLKRSGQQEMEKDEADRLEA